MLCVPGIMLRDLKSNIPRRLMHGWDLEPLSLKQKKPTEAGILSDSETSRDRAVSSSCSCYKRETPLAASSKSRTPLKIKALGQKAWKTPLAMTLSTSSIGSMACFKQ
jgi:hypothetical protein